MLYYLACPKHDDHQDTVPAASTEGTVGNNMQRGEGSAEEVQINLVERESRILKTQVSMPAPLVWKATRGGTCHIDCVLELFVAFSTSFKDIDVV